MRPAIFAARFIVWARPSCSDNFEVALLELMALLPTENHLGATVPIAAATGSARKVNLSGGVGVADWIAASIGIYALSALQAQKRQFKFLDCVTNRLWLGM